MPRKSSYQRRLEDIEFKDQRASEITELLVDAVATLIKFELPIPWAFPKMDGDTYLNDVTSGDYMREVERRARNRIQERKPNLRKMRRRNI